VSAPDLPRFVLSSDCYAVLDTWDVHRIVVDSASTLRGAPLAKRKAYLVKRAAELEAWHAEVTHDAA